MASGLTSGSHVGPYEVIGPLGAGGMGEVYRGRDHRLQRDVAIKIVSRAFAADPERLARLEREARILAALRHPHIAAIHGLESTGDGTALVLEFVDGITLAERIDRGPLDTHEALTIARQIADAVESAHEQGVIHRDLKPANIKVRSDGTVKVLDFGLARADAAAGDAVAASATATAVMTRDGVAMGTPAYMSPEQIRGRAVDRRSDIWAFGCILFEMLTGRPAFGGASSTDTFIEILQQEPAWEALPGEAPPPIVNLIRRCMQRDPRQRLRDIGDARIAIEETLANPQGASAPATVRPPTRFWIRAVPLMFASAAATYLLISTSSSDDRPTFSRFVRLIATAAHEFSPAIAPDGKWVAYLSNARGPTDVWLKSVAGGEPINLTASLDVEVQRQDSIGGLEVSPDGTQVAFAAAALAGEVATYVIPVPLGGTPRRLFQGRQGIRWSRDGARIVFVKPGGALGDSLWVAEADGQNEREIVKHQSARHIHWPRWSADGRHVYFNYGYQGDNAEPTEVFRVPLSGGAPEQVVASARRAVFPLPSPDGRYLFFASNSDGVDATLWERDARTGVDRRLTSGIGEFTTASISADGLRLVATVSDRRQSLVGIQVGRQTPNLEPLTEAYTGDVDPSMSRDGSRIAFSSTRSGSRNLWWARADFSRPVALTTGASIDEAPVYSPDGAQVAFVSDRGGQRGIWVVSADGGTPRSIVTAQVLRSLSWSPDGKRLAFAAPAERLPQIHIVEVDTGKVSVLPTEAAANSPVWALGENLIAYIETRPRTPGHVRFMNAEGKPVSRGPEDTVTALNNGFLAWAPDARRLAGVGLPGNRAGSVWILEPDGAVPFKKLVDLPPDAVPRGIAWSHDGARVIVGLARATGDIVIAERSR